MRSDRPRTQLAATNKSGAFASNAWLRFDWVLTLIFCVAIVTPAFVYLAREGNAQTRLPVISVIASLLILQASMIIWVRRVGNRDFIPHWIRVLYALSIAAGWAILTTYSPTFHWMLFTLFSEIGRWVELRTATVLTSATLTLYVLQITDNTLQTFFDWRNPAIWFVSVAATVMALFTYWISHIIAQSSERNELISRLRETQANLALVERKAGILQERQRLSHEIHDTLAQGFTSIIMHIEAAEQAFPADAATVQAHFNYARETARQNLAQARRVIDDLRPELLEKRSLNDALGRLATQFSERTGVMAGYQATGEPIPLHPDIEVTLLRATQEALNNAQKHAHANAIDVTLSYMRDMVILDVQDDGVGIRPKTTAGGFGLQAMRERVAQFNGSVLIESAENEGTTVAISIPLA